ncbi:MAG: PRC-barrel domain-containing protein [Acetobacteraceae bacterium]|nr:PRC-barrel domain-containing protein [Acetobacteraceae bacterium]
MTHSIKTSRLARAVATLAFALAAPALAADPQPPGGSQAQGGSPNLSATATVQPETGTPSQRNPLLADNDKVRINKLVGTNVYNAKDEKVGDVDDVLVGADGQPDVILSADGRLVQVPWSQFQFGNAKLNSHNKVILPDATAQSLKQAPEFRYTKGR